MSELPPVTNVKFKSEYVLFPELELFIRQLLLKTAFWLTLAIAWKKIPTILM